MLSASHGSFDPPDVARWSVAPHNVIEVEVIDHELLGADAPSPASVRRLCMMTAAARGVHDGHLAVEIVEQERIVELNARHRGNASATDVLAFPVDGVAPSVSPRELGDVVICAERTADIREAVVHGVLHLMGMDHETDRGEMLALQARLLAEDPV
jgi:probable rRNA maturation factor